MILGAIRKEPPVNKLRHKRYMSILGGERGITLVEVLAAMIMLAVGILALAPMMVLSVTGSQFSNDVTTLATAAQRGIEAQITKGSFPSMPYTQSEYVDNKYLVATEVLDETVDASIPPHVYEVKVAVSWTDDAAVDRNMIFTTYATKK